MKEHGRYLIVSPTRDEEKFMRRTLDSVVAQSVRPALWVVVNDGSRDNTGAILDEYARKYDFIRVVHRPDRGGRSVGPGVIDTFYAGLDTVPDLDSYTYLCKLDLDLDLPTDYFERLIARMEGEPRLGTCSGRMYFIEPDTGRHVDEVGSAEMSCGPTKFYRTACFRQIGGFVRQVMWDGIDCHQCRMLGWTARSFDDAGLRFLHLRPMGSSQKGVLRGRARHGYGQYFMGTGFTYLTVSAIYRLFHPPVLIGSLAMWWGYVRAWVTRQPRYGDEKFRRFLGRYQWACLLRGKRAATESVERQQEAVWASHLNPKPETRNPNEIPMPQCSNDRNG